MQRKIKFRVWDKGTGHMHIIGTSQHDSLEMGFKTNAVFYYNLQNGCGSLGDDSEYVLMQNTGLKDENGKEIYEGDIVKFGQYEYQIIYEIGGFGLLDVAGLMIGKIGGINNHVYSLQVLYLECCWEESSAFDLEVIGNIYENPELIEGGKTNDTTQ